MFAVFGVTREVAKIKATELISKGKGTLKEFCDDLEAYTDNVYKIMGPLKLSQTFSNFAQAKQYADLAQVNGRNIKIKKRTGERDSAGDYILNPKTKKPRMSWVAV